MRILRVFGLSKAEMNSIIENAQAEGSPSLRLQERDGEYLVCVQASAPTQAMADTEVPPNFKTFIFVTVLVIYI